MVVGVAADVADRDLRVLALALADHLGQVADGALRSSAGIGTRMTGRRWDDGFRPRSDSRMARSIFGPIALFPRLHADASGRRAATDVGDLADRHQRAVVVDLAPGRGCPDGADVRCGSSDEFAFQRFDANGLILVLGRLLDVISTMLMMLGHSSLGIYARRLNGSAASNMHCGGCYMT